MSTRYCLVFLLATTAVLPACSAAAHHRSLPSVQERALTVGVAQREIREGMAADAVAEALGSPNIVTRTDGAETWVYDRFSTETAYSTVSAGLRALIVGSGNDVVAGASPGVGYASGATSRTQRTLTIIIRFSEDGRVRDFSYHTSRF